jgi:hypothetical protein
LPCVDLQALPAPRRRAEAQRLASAEALACFDLGRAPLLRARLLRLDGDEWLCLLTLHHIAADGWSLGVFVSELSALYAAFRQGRSSPLPALPLQYADYAVWQRQSLTTEALAAELEWWRGLLAGAPAALELPTDRPRPKLASPRGGRERVELPATLRAGLERLGRRAGATLYMTLLAGFGAWLSRYTDQHDLVIGSPVAGRSRRELEGLIGLFMNPLALRLDLAGEPTFEELLGRTRELAFAAFAHQDLPFARLVEALAPERSLQHGPLFQVLFALQTVPLSLDGPGIALQREEIDPGTAKLDLSLELRPGAVAVAGWIEYRRDLFDGATVRRMAAHLGTLLAGAVDAPTARVSELPLLTGGERVQLLCEWSRSPGRWAAPGTVHGLFEAQARLTPHEPAIVTDDGALTFLDLNDSADHLAELIEEQCGD